MFVYLLVIFYIFKIFLSILMVIITLELTRVNPDRNIFSINVELTSTFLLYRGLVHHHHRILKHFDFRGSVVENSQRDTPVLSVLARDKDVNRTISYTLQGDLELLNLIQVDQFTGQVSVRNRIDREVISWLNLTGCRLLIVI